MGKIKPDRRDQLMLLPETINDYIPPGHIARIKDQIVERLNTREIENKYSELGQHTNHPKILIKIIIYGYARGERSGRKISGRCETDTGYIYLAQQYRFDFRTINDFRKNNLQEIKELFVEIIKISKEIVGLLKLGGTKKKGNSANRLTKSKEEYHKWLKKINIRIEEILELDLEGDKIYGDKRGDELLTNEIKLKEKIEEAIKKIRNEEERINLTEFMKRGDGKINASYNCQVRSK